MAFHRIRTLAAFLLAVGFTRHAQCTGGWDEEEPLTLSAALDQLPAKSYGQIFLETTHKKDVPAPKYPDEIQKIAARIGKDKPEELAAAVDVLLKAARENYEGGDWSNLLYDVRDVITASSADAKAAQDYIAWRLEHRDWFGFPPVQQDPSAEPPEKKPEEIDAQKKELEHRSDAATGPLKAHWLFLRGAYLFSGGDRSECCTWFESVVDQFPNHPRAEVAAFLLARCDLVASRAEDLQGADLAAARKKAASSFLAFRRKYPGGRLDADALGWLGALAFDTDDTETALKYYIAQAEDPNHPEVRKSAVFMCEKTLAHMNSDENNAAAFALIAQHPAVVMGYMYQVLNAPESDNFDGKIDPTDKVKKWRRRVLPLIAAQVAKQHDLYKSDDWQPRYLAMLALAASESGDQAQALQITEVPATQLEGSDDLLFARAIALQRASRAPEAITVYRDLLKKFPDSALALGVRLRLALALQDNHQAGAAVVELYSLAKTLSGEKMDHTYNFDPGAPPDSDLASTDSAVYPDIRGADAMQIHCVIDTLLNFAPLSELAAAAGDDAFDDKAKKEYNAVIAERYLAAEDFASAKKYMPAAEYAKHAANLEKLTNAANAAPAGKQKAAKLAEVGDAWAAVRGQLLLLPLDSRVGAMAVASPGADYYSPDDLLTRRDNARALGLPDPDRELEGRDELRHAARFWLKAAREDPATPLSATARWKALESIYKVAAWSAYAETRAREVRMGPASREIYDKLLAEDGGSVEAKRYAAYWSFPDPEKDENGNEIKPWVNHYADGDSDADTDINQLGYDFSDYGAFGVKEEGESDYPDHVDTRINAIADNAGKWAPARIAQEAENLSRLVRSHAGIDDVSRVNFLDDITLVAREKFITPAVLKSYIALRMDILGRTLWDDGQIEKKTYAEGVSGDDEVSAEVEKAIADPSLKSVIDYLECARIGILAAHQTQVETDIHDDKVSSDDTDTQSNPTGGSFASYSSRDYAGMEKLAREFLKKYPRSRKREAVAFVLARSVKELSRPHIFYVEKKSPGTEDAKTGDTYFETEKRVYRREPFSAKHVLEVLDAYDHEFPNGRYAADIRDYRAYVAWQTHDWAPALDLTFAQLRDDKKPDLQREASLRMANIFAELADKDQRADLLAAIKARPGVAALLKTYLTAIQKNYDHPLRYLQAYLTDQLAGVKTTAAAN